MYRGLSIRAGKGLTSICQVHNRVKFIGGGSGLCIGASVDYT